MKRTFYAIRVYGVLVFLLFCFSNSYSTSFQTNSKKNKFNLLLITIDTLRADRLSCYSKDYVSTPVIDALAAKSTLFTRAFAHTSTTLPSHTNILLGTTPLHHGVHDNSSFKVRDEYLTLAEYLKKEGYSTGAFIGAYPLDTIFGLSQGFEIYDDNFGTTAAGTHADERPAEVVVDKALEYLDQARAPWFIWIHCYDPHDPYEPPEPFKSKYSGRPYEGEVAYVDSTLERLFNSLKQKDLYKNTVIVLTGDHGESLGEHGEETHGFLAYNATLRIPLIIYSPDLEPQSVDQNVSHIDLFPTICERLGMDAPSSLQGVSLVPLMLGQILDEKNIYFESLLPYYTMGWAPQRGIIQGRYKYIDSPIPELYDIVKDFDEKNDISQKNDLEIYRKLLSELTDTQESNESVGFNKNIDREALERLRSLGYVGDILGVKKKTFTTDEDVKNLLPYYNKSVEALDLFHSGSEDKSIRFLREVITAKKNIPSAYLNLASIFKLQGRPNDALQVLRMGFDFIPESYQIYTTYVKSLLEAGMWNEILQVFQKIPISKAELDPLIWNSIGLAFLNIGDFEKALQCCEKATLIDETYPISFNNLARIYLAQFNLSTNPEALQKAHINYKKTLELDPKISAAHEGISFVYMFEEDYDRAIYHLETALELQPGIDNIVYNLGVAYLKKGNKPKALSFFNQFKASQSYPKMTLEDKDKLEDYILQCKDKEIFDI